MRCMRSARMSPTMAGPKVFLVDGFSDEREMYMEYLTLNGFDVQAFDNPEAAIEKLRGAPPAAVVTRIRQTRSTMDGIALTEMIRADTSTRHAAIIVITTSILHRDHDAALRAGCDACLILPASPGDLLNAVRSALRARKLEGVPPPPLRGARNRSGKDSGKDIV